MLPEHDAKVLDCKVDKNFEEKIDAEIEWADIVAITSLTPQIDSALYIASKAKLLKKTTIIGGYHATLDPDYVINHPSVDFIVRGEGEHTFKEIVDFLTDNDEKISITEIDGLSFKDGAGNVKHNKPRMMECDLDSLPLPRRDLLNRKDYVYMGAFQDGLETSRGCPHDCTFCCITKMWRHPDQNIRYRTKSVARIIEEIESIDKKVDYLFFKDDNFTIKPERTKEILEAILKSEKARSFSYGCQSRVDTLYHNPWLIDLMKETKFRQVFLGIESVHQQSLDAMNKKNTTPAMTRQVVNALHKKGISVFGGVIIGYPGETKEMVYQNIQFAKSLKMAMVQFTPISAFPGTVFYDEMKEKGMITSDDYSNYDLFHVMMRTDQLSSEEIDQLVKEAYSYYYLDGEYIKLRAKQFLNPFGPYNWLLKRIHKVIKQFLFGGGKMLQGSGMSKSIISEELKNTQIPEALINRNR